MRIIHISAEFAPIAKAGGLGDVLGGLTRELSRIGQNVEVLLPKYDFIPSSSLPQLTDPTHFQCVENSVSYQNTMWRAQVETCKLRLLEIHHPRNYFHRGKIYGCDDDTARFLYFSKACLEYLKMQKEEIDVLHLHDWHTAIVAVLAKDLFSLPIKKIVLTIHNADYQGLCAAWDLDTIGLNGGSYLTEDKLQDGFDPLAINLLKGGIVYADAVNTVSPSYAKEILTQEVGHYLSPTFRKYEKKTVGILNGIDRMIWNPSSDPFLKESYELGTEEKGKEAAKNLIRKHFDLEENQRPWVGAITRIVPQKGPELLEEGLVQTIALGGSFLLLGSSPIPSLQEHFDKLKKKYAKNKNIFLHFEYNEAVAHQLYAALDFLLMPSLREPCGLAQLIAMRYGTIPIVRATGGIRDTVIDCESFKQGNGFVFQGTGKADVSSAIARAIKKFREDPQGMKSLIQHVMKQDFGWGKPVKQYMQMYEKN